MAADRQPPKLWGRAAALGITLTLIAHYAWELLQAPGYASHAAQAMSDYAWHCFVAALGDVAIASASYAITAAVGRRPSWALEPRILGSAGIWIAAGLIITIVVEVWATAVGRWTYAPTMPRVFGIGGLPLAQWLVVPSLTLWLFRVLMRRLEDPGGS